MKCLPQETDFVVVGAGVAGMRAAIELAAAGQVLVLAKNELTESATQYAQGGIAAALSDEDEVALHLQDTLEAGDGLCNVEAARILVEEGPARIQELIEWGTQFDRKGTKLVFAREGAHSRSRVLHAHGDSTGREIGRALYHKAARMKTITFWEFGFTTDLLMEKGAARGILLADENGTVTPVRASAVLLATGGLGQIYSETTNPSVATGDGVAMAHRAGAELTDMEFVQFHPTALYLKNAPRFLLSEALRGEGALLRNAELQRFCHKHHPMGELAPRDVVARAIAHELFVGRMADPVVYLDMTHLDADRVRTRFPRIFATCMQHNIDITAELVPVRPAAHYAMGGVRTDLDGRTSIPRLYAAGEAAGTGVHGANRLASNSLLEGLVYGARAGAAMREVSAPSRKAKKALEESGNHAKRAKAAAKKVEPPKELVEILRQAQKMMWTNVGIVRTATAVREAILTLQELRAKLPMGCDRRSCEVRNVVETGLLVARSALAREESRGAHYRMDFPSHDDHRFKKHSILKGDSIRFEVIPNAPAQKQS